MAGSSIIARMGLDATAFRSGIRNVASQARSLENLGSGLENGFNKASQAFGAIAGAAGAGIAVKAVIDGWTASAENFNTTLNQVGAINFRSTAEEIATASASAVAEIAKQRADLDKYIGKGFNLIGLGQNILSGGTLASDAVANRNELQFQIARLKELAEARQADAEAAAKRAEALKAMNLQIEEGARRDKAAAEAFAERTKAAAIAKVENTGDKNAVSALKQRYDDDDAKKAITDNPLLDDRQKTNLLASLEKQIFDRDKAAREQTAAAAKADYEARAQAIKEGIALQKAELAGGDKAVRQLEAKLELEKAIKEIRDSPTLTDPQKLSLAQALRAQAALKAQAESAKDNPAPGAVPPAETAEARMARLNSAGVRSGYTAGAASALNPANLRQPTQADRLAANSSVARLGLGAMNPLARPSAPAATDPATKMAAALAEQTPIFKEIAKNTAQSVE